jgi:hypothetical protein
MRVILRPLSKDSWSNVRKYRNCHEDIGPYFTRSGSIYTGLTVEDEKRLGERAGLDLRPSSDFWKTFFIRTGARDLYLDTNDAMDELKYLFLKNHKRVKNSLLENKAGANFVLINKDEEAKVTNLHNKTIREAFSAFDKLTATDIRKVLRLYGENGDNMSAEVAEQRLFEFVEGNPERFLLKWVNNNNRETEVVLEKAISANVIRRNINVYKYGSETIGRSKEEALHFLDNPANQDIKRSILIELDAKSSITNPSTHTETSSKIQQMLDSIEEESTDFTEQIEESEVKKIKKSSK